MKARGEVDEADVGRVARGQSVSLRLDAHPETLFTGRVAALRGAVQMRSAASPQKIVHVEIDLDRTDPQRMRPGMRFVGTIETERQKGVVVAPVEAIFNGPEGPVAYRRERWGVEAVHPRLGRHSGSAVEVLAGLAPGDVLTLNPPSGEAGGEAGGADGAAGADRGKGPRTPATGVRGGSGSGSGAGAGAGR
jgi:hypothetical protein